MGITAEVTRLVNKKINELSGKREKLFYKFCKKCNYGSIATSKGESAEWDRLHKDHEKKSTLEKLAEIPAIILDKIVSAIHNEISKK